MSIVKQGEEASCPAGRVREHELKCNPEYFSALLTERKNFEIRDIWLDLKTKRDFRVGDVLVLREFTPCGTCGGTGRVWDNGDRTACDCIPSSNPKGTYTGRVLKRLVTYITDFHQQADTVVMALREWRDPAATMRDCPSPARVRAIVEHVHGLGAYTQAEEIAALGAELERLREDGEGRRAALRASQASSGPRARERRFGEGDSVLLSTVDRRTGKKRLVAAQVIRYSATGKRVYVRITEQPWDGLPSTFVDPRKLKLAAGNLAV
ncbi:MAG: DUF3850 domain-containing protein [Terriglobia bacterium]|nr:DUF3850 domain-containing protein [Terriglobia bacterium]